MATWLIKCGALGDVVRTTALLAPINAEWNTDVVWVTAEEAAPLVEGLPGVSQVVDVERLQATLSSGTKTGLPTVDTVVNLDDGRREAKLASSLGGVLHGAYWDSTSETVRYTPDLERWFGMGLLRPQSAGGLAEANRLKKANTRSMQEILYDCFAFNSPVARPSVPITEGDRGETAKMLGQFFRPRQTVVGVNVGAGGRWKYKSWRDDYAVRLCRSLVDSGVGVALLGGPGELDRNVRIAELTASPSVRIMPHDLTVSAFAALIGGLDCIFSTDSLALHLAIAMGTRFVAYFGPTSASEIHTYDLGEKIRADVPCHTCYLATCRKEWRCVDAVGPRLVFDALTRQLELATAADRPSLSRG